MSTKYLLNIFCSIQRALLEKVTPKLRAVYVVIKNSNSFETVFYYDEILSEEEEELVSLADTEILADFPSPEYETLCHIKIVSYPKKILQEGRPLYRRYES